MAFRRALALAARMRGFFSATSLRARCPGQGPSRKSGLGRGLEADQAFECGHLKTWSAPLITSARPAAGARAPQEARAPIVGRGEEAPVLASACCHNFRPFSHRASQGSHATATAPLQLPTRQAQAPHQPCWACAESPRRLTRPLPASPHRDRARSEHHRERTSASASALNAKRASRPLPTRPHERTERATLSRGTLKPHRANQR